MSKKEKLCKWEKQEFQDNYAKLVKIVKKPQYICIKCGRVSKNKNYICKPLEIDSEKSN